MAIGEPGGLARKTLADYQRGVDLVSVGHYSLAMAPLENCLHQEADFAEARLLLIRILRRLGRYTEALAKIRSFEGSPDKEIEVLLEAVPAALFSGQPALALRSAWKVWEHLPTWGHQSVAVPQTLGIPRESLPGIDLDLRSWLVLITLYEEGHRAALKAVRSCLHRDSNWLKGYFLQAGILELYGDNSRAAGTYTRILEIDPSQTQSLEALQRLWGGATIERNPLRTEYVSFFIMEANHLLQVDYSESIAHTIETWLGLFPGTAELLRCLVNVLISMGQHQRALQAIDQIPTPNLTLDILCLRAEVLEGSGDEAEAAALFHAILAQDPTQKRACAGIVRLGSALENFSQTLHSIDIALKHSPEDANLWYTKALLLKQRGMRSEMVGALEEAVILDPRHTGVLYALGMERLHQKRTEEAVLLFGDLVTLEPTNQEGWRNLAIAQTQRRQWEDALDTWRRLLELAPGDQQAQGNISRLEQFLLERKVIIQPPEKRND